jgi:hypothetical protein
MPKGQRDAMTNKLRPILVDGDVAYVTLTKGYTAVIDVEDVPLVDGGNWTASPHRKTVYAVRRAKGGRGREKLHRVVMGCEGSVLVDHIDGDGLNNRRRGKSGNLRLATAEENARNTGKRPSNTSGFKGVSWLKSRARWQAQIGMNGKGKVLGYFKCPTAAYFAYCRASRALHGEFGRLL